MGLLTGTVLGAGLGMLLAPKAGSELRGAIGEQAKNLGNAATEQYKKASETAGTWAERGREMVDKAKEAVTRGADEARSYASGEQPYLAFPLLVGIVPPELRHGLMENLVETIEKKRRGHIDAGMHGTYFLLKLFPHGYHGKDEEIGSKRALPRRPEK